MIAVLVPALISIDTSFSTSRPPSVTATCAAVMCPSIGVVTVPRACGGGAESTALMRPNDALDWAMTLLMKPIMITGKIRIER
jgi:hypothetical protein